jgi:hypothetical protein
MPIEATDAASVTVPTTVAIPNATLASPFIVVIRCYCVGTFVCRHIVGAGSMGQAARHAPSRPTERDQLMTWITLRDEGSMMTRSLLTIA